MSGNENVRNAKPRRKKLGRDQKRRDSDNDAE